MRSISAHSPLAYLLTFRCYGTWLPGDARGWVSKNHRTPNAAYLPPSPGLEEFIRVSRMSGMAMWLCERRREIVHATILQDCAYRRYVVHALNVRTNHVHLVLSADAKPEAVMNRLKSWTTRRLVEASAVRPEQKVWARHGSTRFLWVAASIEAACTYVMEGQGNALAS